MSAIHKSTSRDYLARVNDKEYPKAKAASLAKQWGYEYWDGDRRICYGGYKYIPGRWIPVAQGMYEHYSLNEDSKILDIGCGKGFQLKEFQNISNKIRLRGIDISRYALDNAHPDLAPFLDLGSAIKLPYADKEFDFAFSINTLHNLNNVDLEQALLEITRVSKKQYICVESFRTEEEKVNLLYWQLTCQQFNSPIDWEWWFSKTGFTGDYSFIFFE